MDIPELEKEALEQSDENSACYLDDLPDELVLHIFGFAANQETVKDRFLHLEQLSLVRGKWAALATDQLLLKSILYSDAELIALGEKAC